jgi:hypothetical protein
MRTQDWAARNYLLFGVSLDVVSADSRFDLNYDCASKLRCINRLHDYTIVEYGRIGIAR